MLKFDDIEIDIILKEINMSQRINKKAVLVLINLKKALVGIEIKLYVFTIDCRALCLKLGDD